MVRSKFGNQRKILKDIHSFPSMIKYLRDEMAWPIESTNFERDCCLTLAADL